VSRLLDDLVHLSGLSPIFARTVVRRAIVRAGIDPESIQRRDVERVLPELRRALTVYLGDMGADDRAARIRRVINE